MGPLTESQPVGGGVTQVGNELGEQLYHVTHIAVQETQRLLTQREYIEMPQYEILSSII